MRVHLHLHSHVQLVICVILYVLYYDYVSCFDCTVVVVGLSVLVGFEMKNTLSAHYLTNVAALVHNFTDPRLLMKGDRSF